MRLLEHYPEFLRASPEFADIQNALDPEITALRDSLDGLAAQLDLETATWGLDLWEETLGLPTVPDSGLEERRGKIRARLRGAGTATREAVRAVVAGFTGGEVTLIEHAREFLLELKFSTDRLLDLTDVSAELREILPAHLTFTLDLTVAEVESILHLGGAVGELSGIPGAAEANRTERAVLALGGPPGTEAWTFPGGAEGPRVQEAVIYLGGFPGTPVLTLPRGSPQENPPVRAVLETGGAVGTETALLPGGEEAPEAVP